MLYLVCTGKSHTTGEMPVPLSDVLPLPPLDIGAPGSQDFRLGLNYSTVFPGSPAYRQIMAYNHVSNFHDKSPLIYLYIPLACLWKMDYYICVANNI